MDGGRAKLRRALGPSLARKAGTQFSSFKTGTEASVTPVAVVFQGGSAVGDDESIGLILPAKLKRRT